MNMVQHSGSSKEGNIVFDFSSPTAVMAILKTLRTHSEVSASVRNEIRDLIFSYTNNGGDEASLEVIKSRLVAVGITPEHIGQQPTTGVLSKVPEKETPKAGFPSGRVTPVFSGSFIPAEKSTNLATKIIEKEKGAPTDQSVVAAQVPQTVPQGTNKIVPKIPAEQASTKSDTIPTLARGDTLAVVSPKPQIKTPSSDAKQTVQPKEELHENLPEDTKPILDGEKSDNPDTSAFLERIRVIKADINSRAGNPVNLVSINNAIGREYMSALLDAMKQLGSGNSSTISSAMKRLELAYEQSLSVLEMSPTQEQTKGKNNEVPETSDAPTPTSTTSIASVTSSAPLTPVSSVSIPTPITPSETEPASTDVSKDSSVPQIQASPVVEDILSQAKPEMLSVSEQTKPISSINHPNPPLGVTRPIVLVQSHTQPVVSTPSTSVPLASASDETKQPPSSASVPIHSSKLTPAKSVAMATPLRKVEELPTLAEVKNRSESGNPLYAQKISDGLEQLLSEWTIFRKSGVFGTGPRGSEHPLFKKLAPLKIPLIIAGRFEGATEEVRQSITDYMNGWRYEQGIVYEKEETFEEYLRRVIKHIIDSQKK